MKADVKQIDDLLSQLDKYAEEYDSYAYGLPINFTDRNDELNDQREIVREWLKEYNDFIKNHERTANKKS